MKTAQVTIISLWSRRDLPASAAPAAAPRYTVQVERREDAMMTLEQAFMLTNRDDRPLGGTFCSTTAGDMMILDDQHYLVEGGGYHAVTPEEAAVIETLTTRDTSWGYDDLKKHNLI